MSDFEQLDIIAVSPHPDDVELGCAGILAKYANLGYNVGIIDLTNGEPTPFNDDPEIRIKEAQESAKILGIKKRIILDLPNRILFDSYESRIKLATELRKYKPKLVLSMYGSTPLASPDHEQAQKITEGAFFYSKLTKWDNKFDNTKPHQIYGLLYFHTGREIVPTTALYPFIMNINDEFEQKISAISCYNSQFKSDDRFRGVIKWVTEIAQYYGMQINKNYGEVLFSPKMLEVEDLAKFF